MKYQNPLINTVFKIAYTCNVIIKTSYYILISKGQIKQAIRWSSINRYSQPIPWYTYPCLSFLEKVDFSGMSVFEYGSGNSTLWWGSKAKSVVSVEIDQNWWQQISPHLLQNTTYILASSKKQYISAIMGRKKKYDVIIVDGGWREECLKVSVAQLSKRGMIILDNSDRYPHLLDGIANKINGIRIDFVGLGPINAYEWTTSIFIKRTSLLTFFKQKNPSHVT